MQERAFSFRLTLLLGLYVAEGLPSGLCTEALPALLRSYGVSATLIGASGILMVPWGIKFLWAPFVDRWHWPRVGQYRSWIVPTQLLLAALLLLLAQMNPEHLRDGHGLLPLLSLLFLVNTLSATHDIATDALSVRCLQGEERGLGNGIQVAGYRLGLIGGGGLLLFGIGSWGWQGSFTVLAFCPLLLILPLLWYREPPPLPERDSQSSYFTVFREFWSGPGMRGWFVALLLCKVGELLGSAMVKPMFVDMHFSLRQIGLMVSVIGSSATLVGALLGGYLAGRMGRVRAIAVFYVLEALAMLGYAAIAFCYRAGQPLPDAVVYGCNALEHLASGMATAALLTVIMDCCREEHAGADFTAQVSLMTMGGGTVYLFAGRLKDLLGYPVFFLVAGVVALVLLVPITRRCRVVEEGGLVVGGLLRENAGP